MDEIAQGKVTLADKVKAATAYCMDRDRFGNEDSVYAWGCGGFRALCDIKCNAVMSKDSNDIPIRISTEEVSPSKFKLIFRCISL